MLLTHSHWNWRLSTVQVHDRRLHTPCTWYSYWRRSKADLFPVYAGGNISPRPPERGTRRGKVGGTRHTPDDYERELYSSRDSCASYKMSDRVDSESWGSPKNTRRRDLQSWKKQKTTSARLGATTSLSNRLHWGTPMYSKRILGLIQCHLKLEQSIVHLDSTLYQSKIRRHLEATTQLYEPIRKKS